MKKTLIILLGISLAIISCSKDSKEASFQKEDPIVTIKDGDISLNSIEENQIIDGPLTIGVKIENTNVTVGSLEVFMDGEIIYSAQNKNEFELSFNPEEYATGDHILEVTVKDSDGNTAAKEIGFKIYRRLLTVNRPVQNVNPEQLSFIVFASSANGELLDVREMGVSDLSLTLSTLVDIRLGEEYMLTFAEKIDGRFGEANELTTIQNISRSTLDEINLSVRPKFTSNWNPIYPSSFEIQNLWKTTEDLEALLGGGGFDHNVSPTTNGAFSENPPADEIAILRSENIAYNLQSSEVYLTHVNITNRDGSYALINIDQLTNDFVVDSTLFTTNGIESREIQIGNVGSGFQEYGSIKLMGYLNEQSFQNNAYHTINDAGFELSIEKYEYWFNSIFEKFRYRIHIKNYRVEGIGEIEEIYTPLDWTIDFTFADNEFEIIKNSDGNDMLGKIFIANSHIGANETGGSGSVMNGQEQTYWWSIIFDSQKQEKVILPSLPEELKSWRFYDNYLNQEHSRKQIEIRKYENVSDYEDYLNTIIKNNRYWYLISPKKEMVYKPKGEWPGYNNPNNFILD